MPESISLHVQENEAGQRLDVFVTRGVQSASRSAVQRWIESGGVKVDGRLQKANYPVREGQTVSVAPPEPEPVDVVAQAIPLRIIHEDDELVVIDKSAGMVVHPGAGNPSGTLVNALLHHFRQVSRTHTVRPGIVHRLDKATSGLMVVAKSDRVHDFLARQFKERRVEKHYMALVYGRLQRRRGVVDVPVGRDPWARTKISVRGRKRRHAVTKYRVLRYYSHFTFVEVLPETGRTHQIRVHFQHLGHPLVGDETYGGKADRLSNDVELRNRIRKLGRHFLHAGRLCFVHPSSHQPVQYETPLAPELAEFLSGLG